MSINRKILEQVIKATAEPLVIVRVDHSDWPVGAIRTQQKIDACEFRGSSVKIRRCPATVSQVKT